MRNLYPILILAILLSACCSNKDLKEFSKNQIIFGSGGGFTGATDLYALDYKGQLQKYNSLSKETIDLPAIPAKEAKGYFRSFLEHGFDTLEYSSPGNMTYFIGYKNDSTDKRINWGAGQETPEGVQEYYNSLLKTVSNNNKE